MTAPLRHWALAEIAADAYRPGYSASLPGDLHYALAPRGDELVVALPGTQPNMAIDWLRDMRIWPSWVRGIGPVHSGFGKAARALWARMAPDLGVHHALVTFVGHSLGAGVGADLAALHAYHRPGVAFRFVGFAGPRSGFCNPWLHRLLAEGVEAVNYARCGDLVPHVPTFPYHHGCKTVTIGRSTGDWIADHAVLRYRDDLRALDL